MKKFLLNLFLIGNLLLTFTITAKNLDTEINPTIELSKPTEDKLLRHVNAIKELVKTDPNYNSEIAFFVDMEIMSGKNRFFIYDLKNDRLIDQGLVAQGFGTRTNADGKLKFSNENNSLCTSLGKYSIGNSYQGKYGKAYKLKGLDATNSNAEIRNIVLHKCDTMPLEEQDNPITYSFGCPMVNNVYYSKIQQVIDASKKKILLDIYY